MATYYARKAGNIDASDVWATTPSGTAAAVTFASGDVLVANSFAVTVNVSVNLGSAGEVRNDTTGSATAGGSFSLSNGVTLTANVIAGGAATCVTTSGTASATVVGNVTGGSGTSTHGISHAASGTLTVTGSVTGGSGNTAQGVVTTSGSVNITGAVSGGSGSTAAGLEMNGGTGISTITGNVTGGSAANGWGARNNTTTTLTITGTVTGGSNATAYGAFNASTGTLAVVGTCVGAVTPGVFSTTNGTITATRAKGGALATSAVGVSASTGGSTTVEEIEFGDLGASPTSGPIRLSDKTTNVALFYRPSTTKKTLVDAASTGYLPAASDVRSGTSYAAGARTGTLAVPAASLVASGVAVDNTTGTAAITSAAIQSACDSALTAFSSGRLSNVATVASTGQQIADATV